jgi:regulator of replication initiation timing
MNVNELAIILEPFIDEHAALHVENARLRETLENSVIMIQGCYDAPTNPDSLPQMLLHYIRAALEVKP